VRLWIRGGEVGDGIGDIVSFSVGCVDGVVALDTF
jgi:hypothetical protein